MSMFNWRWLEWNNDPNKTQEGLLKLYVDATLIDPTLAEFGFDQTLHGAKATSKINVHTVFVSPLRRALTTAHNLFCQHPNFENINFVVEPLMRERIHTTCDIPGPLNVLLKEFKEKIPQLNTSAFDRYDKQELWYIEDLENTIKETIKAQMNEGKTPEEAIFEKIKQNFPGSVESLANIVKRIEKLVPMVKDYIKESEVPRE